MEGSQMAKGLCPGVGRSRGKESIEKRGRERETNIPRVMWKTNKALTQDLYRSQGTGRPLEEVLKAQAGK